MQYVHDLGPEDAVLNLEGELVLEEVDGGERRPGRHRLQLRVGPVECLSQGAPNEVNASCLKVITYSYTFILYKGASI